MNEFIYFYGWDFITKNKNLKQFLFKNFAFKVKDEEEEDRPSPTKRKMFWAHNFGKSTLFGQNHPQ
jgi:hypothetical protein